MLKSLVSILLIALAALSATAQQTDLQGYSPKVSSYGNYYNQLRADIQHIPHRYGLIQGNTTDSTPQIFVWSTPYGDSLELFVNGRYITIGTGGSGGYTADETTLHLATGNQFSILSTYPGQTSITTVGTIAAGTWESTPIADAYVASAATWNAKLGSALSSANIFVGNGSNNAVGVPMTGDATMNNAGVFTLGTTISAGSCTNCNITYDAKGRIIAATNGSGGGSGAPFNDNVALIQNSSDNTRKLILSAASVPTGTTVTWTFPGGSNGTVAATNLAQTFGNTQTFSAAPIFTPLTGYLYANGSSALTASTTIPYANVTGGPGVFGTTTNGLVPAPGSATGKVLDDFGAWVTNGSGTVLLPFYRVTDYGLTMAMSGTGTDVTSYIQAAINAAYAAGGGIVWLPPGFWSVSSLNMTGMGTVFLKGAGMQNTFLSANTVGDTLIKFNNIQFLTAPGTGSGNAPGYGIAQMSGFTLEGHNKAAMGVNLQYGYWFWWDDICVDSCTAIGLNLKGTLTGKLSNMLVKWCPVGIWADTINLAGGMVLANLLTFDHPHIYNCPNWAINTNYSGGAIKIIAPDFEDNGTNHAPLTGVLQMTNSSGYSSLSWDGGWMEHNQGSLIRIENTLSAFSLSLNDITVVNSLTPSYGLYLNPSYATQVNIKGTSFVSDSIDYNYNGFVTTNEMASSFTTSTVASASRYVFEHQYGTAYAVAWPKGASGSSFVSSTGTGLGTGGTVTLSNWSTSLGGTVTITFGTSPAASSNIMIYAYDDAWSTVGVTPSLTESNTAAKELQGDAAITANETGTHNYIGLATGPIPPPAGTVAIYHLSLVGQ